MQPPISVIIVNWNVAESLKRCLNSVFATKYSSLEVIIVDNASSDKSLKILKNYADLTTIKNSLNLGFPKAVNQGLKIATGDYILLLNPDTQLPKDFFIKAIAFAKSHPDMGIMGPKFTDPDGTAQGSIFQEPSIFKNCLVVILRQTWFQDNSQKTPPQNNPC